jgi:hypothetical protein
MTDWYGVATVGASGLDGSDEDGSGRGGELQAASVNASARNNVNFICNDPNENWPT